MNSQLAVRLWLLSCSIFHLAFLAENARALEVDFEKEIVPIFQKHCYRCHNDSETKGNFSIHSQKAFFQGGESGSTIDPDSFGASLLLELIAPASGKPSMPKDGEPLSPAEVAVVKAWVLEGAKWPDGKTIDEPVVRDTDWWSLRPIVASKPPSDDQVKAGLDPHVASKLAENEIKLSNIDRFIAARLAREGLRMSPQADRQILIRRLYFDLIGLPPTPQEVESFVKDSSPDAYERLVNRLLESPQYGERWARHWLDVVHFGETHGYDKDKPRPNAWPYRDYVIQSLNADKPYGEFVREQLAADALKPNQPELIPALGFISAGPWDFIGHAEVPESKIDGKVARHLDRDDMVQNTIMTFCSLTIGCAQCHNHKFDPITSEDYYSLQAVFAAIDRTDRAYDADPVVGAKRGQLRAELDLNQAALSESMAKFVELGGAELKQLDEQIAAGTANSPAPPEHGYHSNIEPNPLTVKWVQVDLGSEKNLAALELIACHDDFAGIGDGFGFPIQFKIELSNDAEFAKDVVIARDETTADFSNPKRSPVRVDLNQEVAKRAYRYVRVTATKLATRQNDYIFALSELRAIDTTGTNVAEKKSVSALDSIEAPSRWQKSNLVDGIYPKYALSSQELAKLQGDRINLIAERIPAELQAKLDQLNAQKAGLEQSLAALPAQQIAYVGAVHTGSGAFEGTGRNGGKPRTISVLPRGDVTKPGKEVSPGALTALNHLPSRFEDLLEKPESERRVALANWLTDDANPLFWRSIVNRVWMYHFGRGIVDTPNDFGRMGDQPSHPELLDNLAVEFRDQGQSLKKLHFQIVTSLAYQQTSSPSMLTPEDRERQKKRLEIDGENRLLWKQNRRRLEAEAIRDAILFVSGKLDLTMGGPSFQDFVVDKPEHSPHYEYHLHDAEDPKSHRRSVYRFIVRSKTQPFMTTFDCADPSMQVEKRNLTITPLQALALLNNQLTVVMAKHFAESLRKESADATAQLRSGFARVTGRTPDEAELAELIAYNKEFGLENSCRLLLNLNEFVFVD